MIIKPKLVIAFAQVILCAIVLASPNTTFNVVMSLMNFVLGILYVYFSKRRLLTFAVIFASLSFILHMGWFIAVNLFGFNSSYLSYPSKTVNLSILLCMLCHTAFFWGGGSNKIRRIKSIIPVNQLIDRKSVVSVGVLCCILGVYSRITILMKQLISAQVYGYSGVSPEEMGIDGILVQFYYVGVLILISGLKEKKNIARVILLVTILVEIVSIFTGGRIYAISMIIAIAYVYFTMIEKPNRWMILSGIAVAYALSVIMSAIASVRTQGGIDIANVLSTADSSTNSPFISFLAEMGATMIDIIYAITDFPAYTPYGLGMSYVDSLFSVFPYYEKNIANEVNLYFIKGFRSYSSLGGSWIGEAYYNFSWLSCVFCYFVGKVFGRIENMFERCNKTGNYTSLLVILSFLFYFISYARDYFYKFVTTIQVCLVVLVIAYIFSMIKGTKNNKCNPRSSIKSSYQRL